ncbi:MAG: DUF1002 domain-containing protein [Clostridiaceae bacterium]|nr:DUF1002 domain-containing protein [Clostridiaceae bacterium]
MRNKNKILAILMITFMLLMAMPLGADVRAASELDYFTYGAGLSEAQLSETERLIGVPQDESIKRLVVNSSDFNKYTGRTTQDSALYSSAYISKQSDNSGVRVYINTPQNITQIKDHQYMNAALTSGITDVNIVVGAPIQVTGETALVGVYKALEDAGYTLDEDATQTATDELFVINEISQNNTENEDFDSEDFSKAIAEIKRQISEISDRENLSSDQITVIINNVLNEYNITISEADKDKLAGWLNDFKALDIDWNAIGEELSGLGELISEKGDEIYEWGVESGFFTRLWEAIKSFFNNLFG